MDEGAGEQQEGRGAERRTALPKEKSSEGEIPGAFRGEINPGGAGRRKPLRRCETSRAERAG